MNRDTIQTIGIFIAGILLLGAIVIGGIRFVKQRDASLAQANQPQATQQNQPQAQPEEPAAPAEPEVAVTDPEVAPPIGQTAEPSVAQAPAQNENPVSGQQGQTATEVPATGPSSVDFVVTGMLMMIAVYLGISISRSTKSLHRRLLS